MSTSALATAAIVAVSITLMLVRPRGVAEVWWVGAGAILLVVAGLIPLARAATAVEKGVDVYAFLLGMMLLSNLAREHGVFRWMSSRTIRASRGSKVRLFGLVYAVGTVVTIFMSNDATAVVLTPAILTATRDAKAEPLPYAFACAFIANAASFVLPISNPANLVVFRGHVPTLAQWLIAFGGPSLVAIGVTYLVLRVLFRRELFGRLEVASMRHEPLGMSGRLVLAGLGFVAMVLACASGHHANLGIPALTSALLVALVVSVAAKTKLLPLARKISWSTLLLVAALFMMVEAVEAIGALDTATTYLTRAAALPRVEAVFVAGFAVGAANNLINNLPLGLIAGSTLEAVGSASSLQQPILIGVDLGPNLAVTGSLSTILWLIALRKEGICVSFWQFFKVGVLTMPASLAASLAVSLLTS